MKCPWCESEKTHKNGKINGRPRHRCRDCWRTFVDNPIKGCHSPRRAYDLDVKGKCLELCEQGLGAGEIASRLQIPKGRVYVWTTNKDRALTKPQRVVLTEDRKRDKNTVYGQKTIDKAIGLWYQGCSYAEILEKTEVKSPQTVRNWIAKHLKMKEYDIKL
jgi:transposase-like protein